MGKKTGAVNVWLSRDVDVSRPDDVVPLYIEGGGRFIGLVLTSLSGRGKDTGPTLAIGSFAHCVTDACAAVRDRGWFMFGSQLRDGNVLPEGGYRAYFVADGSEAEVVVHFGGLEGKRVIRPSEKATARIQTITTQTEATGNRNLYWGGAASDLRGSGMAAIGLWLKGRQLVASGSGFCVYAERPVNSTLAYIPPCASSSPGADVVTTSGMPENYEMSGTAMIDSLPPALGAWYSSASVVDQSGAAAVWLKF